MSITLDLSASIVIFPRTMMMNRFAVFLLA
jgi:hypothetical protein